MEENATTEFPIYLKIIRLLMGDRLIVVERQKRSDNEITFEWNFEPREDK